MRDGADPMVLLVGIALVQPHDTTDHEAHRAHHLRVARDGACGAGWRPGHGLVASAWEGRAVRSARVTGSTVSPMAAEVAISDIASESGASSVVAAADG